MIHEQAAPIIALAIATSAVVVWGLVFARTVRAYAAHIEQRLVWLTMATGALLASVGTLASAIGFAVQRGLLTSAVPQDVWSFLASVGRGALLMAGLIVLTHYRPPKGHS